MRVHDQVTVREFLEELRRFRLWDEPWLHELGAEIRGYDLSDSALRYRLDHFVTGYIPCLCVFSGGRLTVLHIHTSWENCAWHKKWAVYQTKTAPHKWDSEDITTGKEVRAHEELDDAKRDFVSRIDPLVRLGFAATPSKKDDNHG